MNRLAFLAAPFFLMACTLPTVQGGENGNDRSNGGEQGEALLTGSMVVSPDGKFAVMQRNQTTVLFDIEKAEAKELSEQVERFVFKKGGGGGIAVVGGTHDVVSYDLPSLDEVWRTPVDLHAAGAKLARLSDDDQHLVIGDVSSVIVLDAATGDVRGTIPMKSDPAELAFVPGGDHALIVGGTHWESHKPATDVMDLDLASLGYVPITVPNCTAPISVMPDASRAFLSPTFCEEGGVSTPKQQWTNPDPVSVIDLTSDGPKFLKNLPGFGPVSMNAEGSLVVAYLDVERMDASMFEDKSKVPSTSGKRYHLMTIDPTSLAYDLTPIGNVLPRFILSKSGESLLVDATVTLVRGEATAKATIDTSGNFTVSLDVFGDTESLFGMFDLAGKKYTPFAGQAASLDRFVQMGDEKRVFTLKMQTDGLGGMLYRIDLDTGTATSLNHSLRDIGVLADGERLLLRERLPAGQTNDGTTVSWYRRERYCVSLDGIVCDVNVEFQDSVPFQTGPTCQGSHDCF